MKDKIQERRMNQIQDDGNEETHFYSINAENN